MKHSIIFIALSFSATAFAQQMPHKSMANAATATATPQAPQPLASDPAAHVPAVVYRSVFKETSLGVEKDSENWRKANDDVGKFLRGHVDILKWEALEKAKAAKADMPEPAMPAKTHASPNLSAPDARQVPKPAPAPAHKH